MTQARSVICDIDGVILHDNQLIPGADTFVHRLLEQGTRLLFLTNYPGQTPKDLQNRFLNAGIHVPEECFYTSAMATADFLRRQEGRKVYVIGEGALTHELYMAGFTITDIDPDIVVVGETRNYNWNMIQLAAQFIMQGARFIATNPDTHGPHMHPACGALCAPIERMTGRNPFYIGKPSAWIIRAALNRNPCRAEPHEQPFRPHAHHRRQPEDRHPGRLPGRSGNRAGALRGQSDRRHRPGPLSSQPHLRVRRRHRSRLSQGPPVPTWPQSA